MFLKRIYCCKYCLWTFWILWSIFWKNFERICTCFSLDESLYFYLFFKIKISFLTKKFFFKFL